MKKLFLVVMACYAITARSQTNESKNFIYLSSDSIIYAEHVRLRPDFVGSWVLRADSRRVPLEQVKFFNNEDGFFATIRKANIFATNSLSERIIKGKINLYQEVTYNPVPYQVDYYHFRERVPRAISTKMFYNKGYSDIKKVSYANLKMDMADNPKSLDFLKNYRKSKTVGIAMYVAAGAAIVASVVTLFSDDGFKTAAPTFGHMPNYEMKNNDTRSFLLMGLGAGLGLGGYLIQAAGSRNIENAIDAYNR